MMSIRDGFFLRKPTTIEVLNAIFNQAFTPEELKLMKYPEGSPLIVNDAEFKKDILYLADVMKPRYSIEESVRLTKWYVDLFRDDLQFGRVDISIYIVREIFQENKGR